jgi:protein-S-isoprenylcysteine O-methyltransferase Ste14
MQTAFYSLIYTLMTQEMTQEKKLDWKNIAIYTVIGLAFIAFIVRLWGDITARENATADTTYKVHRIAALLYNYLGKTVMFCVLGLIPLLFFFLARKGRYGDDDDEDDD